jgi:AcrR family transcriptional regulator
MRHPLTRERVCQEALALVDAHGLEALSMRRLGARLGVEAMSLYKHVRDKADLLDALHAAVLGTLEPEGGAGDGQWRALLGGLARALRSALLRHPHVLPLFTTRPVSAPEAVAVVARVQEALAKGGFRPAEAERAIYVVGMFTIGHAMFEKTDQRSSTFTFGLDALLDGIERAHKKRRSK